MQRAFRAILVWVMVIAMPLQGVAASAMVLCGPLHDGAGRAHGAHGVQAPAHGSSPVERHVRTHAADEAHTHAQHSAGDPAHADPEATADVDTAADFAPHHGKHGCSVCASCCIALALPASFVLPGVAGPAHAVHASLDAPVASPPLSGLDRPPRTDLA